jgi:hypothetical protein
MASQTKNPHTGQGTGGGPAGEKRSEPRVYFELPARVEKLDGTDPRPATIENYDNSGLYFRTDLPLEAGEEVRLRIAALPEEEGTAPDEHFRIKIRRVATLSEAPGLYGYGASALPAPEKPRRAPAAPDGFSELRAHPRKKYYKWIYFASEGRHYRGLMQDISRSGLFIRTRDRFSRKQRLRLVIPGTVVDRGTMLKGEVVRSNPEGVGVKFTGVIKTPRPAGAQ